MKCNNNTLTNSSDCCCTAVTESTGMLIQHQITSSLSSTPSLETPAIEKEEVQATASCCSISSTTTTLLQSSSSSLLVLPKNVISEEVVVEDEVLESNNDKESNYDDDNSIDDNGNNEINNNDNNNDDDNDDNDNKQQQHHSQPRQSQQLKQKPLLHILCVGDGDLSLSLSLIRAYSHNNIRIVTTTILSSEYELIQTYPNSVPYILNEFHKININQNNNNDYNNNNVITVLYNVDACHLHTNHDIIKVLQQKKQQQQEQPMKFDIVLFNHPHLGDIINNDNNDDDANNNVNNEMIHIHKHHILLSHYLYSASHISHYIHVCLCSNQYNSWKLYEASIRNHLHLIKEVPVQKPFHFIFPKPFDTEIETNIASTSNQIIIKRSHRTSKRNNNNKHWLCKYGYQHVRTNGQYHDTSIRSPPPNLLGSKHYVFCGDGGSTGTTIQNVELQEKQHELLSSIIDQPTLLLHQQHPSNTTVTKEDIDVKITNELRCHICDTTFTSMEEKLLHDIEPARPQKIKDLFSLRNEDDHNNDDQKDNVISNTDITHARRSASTGTNISYNGHDDTSMKIMKDDIEVVATKRIEKSISSSTSSTKKSTVVDDIRNIDNTIGRQQPPQPQKDPRLLLQSVELEYDGKRLRWYLQHCIMILNTNQNNDSNHNNHNKRQQTSFSKRQCGNMIQKGYVQINNEIVNDSSRILHHGNMITLLSSNNNINGSNTNTENHLVSLDNDNHNNKNSQLPLHDHENTSSTNFEGHDVISSKNKLNDRIPIIARWEHYNCIVVLKPSGMRSIGLFDHRTLEAIILQQEKKQYDCITKLDTGCMGLSILQQHNELQQQQQQHGIMNSNLCWDIHYTFTALVHGHVPLHWKDNDIVIQLHVDSMRRWNNKKKKQKLNCQKQNDTILMVDDDDNIPQMELVSSSNDIMNNDCDQYYSATIRLLEMTSTSLSSSQQQQCHGDGNDNSNELLLSTISITTNANVSGLANCIAFHMRKVFNYPVVGDRFTSNEYLTLPRSIRNRLKQRFCMGCTKISMQRNNDSRSDISHNNDNSSKSHCDDNDDNHNDDTNRQYVASYPIPDKWKASYWMEHYINSNHRSSSLS